MISEPVQKPKVTLVGVSVRTTNAEEASPNGKLPQLWETYFSSNTLLQTGANNPHLIYALYTDYESDATGAYTVLIGHDAGEDVVQSDSNYPQIVIPESKYIVFTTKKGLVYEVVAQAWGEIWEYFKERPEARSYTGDFELYDSRSFDPTNTKVQIYIAIK